VFGMLADKDIEGVIVAPRYNAGISASGMSPRLERPARRLALNRSGPDAMGGMRHVTYRMPWTRIAEAWRAACQTGRAG
jgi:hypothetical protein